MATKTVLEYVNDVLSEMDSRRVASVDDTDEAATVRDIMESVFYELQAVRPYRRARRYKSGSVVPITINATSRLTYDLPQSITELDDVYFKQTDGVRRQLIYLFPEDFAERQDRLSLNSGNVSSDPLALPDFNGNFLYYTDKEPTYYTSFNDQQIVIDSVDEDDVGVLGSYGEERFHLRYSEEIDFPALETDNFIELPQDVMQLVILHTKHRAMIALKNMNNSAIERQIRKLERYLSRNQKVVGDDFPMANYGRHSQKPSSNWTFAK